MSGTTAIGTSILSCGRSLKALPIALTLSAPAASIATLPGWKSMNSISGPPPNSAPSRANGAVTAFSKMLTNTFQMIGARRKLGSSSEPRHRKIQVDDALAVLEQGDRQLDRQRDGVLARGLFTELELIDDDVMLRIELAAVDLVVQFRA